MAMSILFSYGQQDTGRTIAIEVNFTKVDPFTKVGPSTKVDPFTKVDPGTKVDPCTKVYPLLARPLQKQTPPSTLRVLAIYLKISLTKVDPLTKIDPFTKGSIQKNYAGAWHRGKNLNVGIVGSGS